MWWVLWEFSKNKFSWSCCLGPFFFLKKLAKWRIFATKTSKWKSLLGRRSDGGGVILVRTHSLSVQRRERRQTLHDWSTENVRTRHHNTYNGPTSLTYGRKKGKERKEVPVGPPSALCPVPTHLPHHCFSSFFLNFWNIPIRQSIPRKI